MAGIDLKVPIQVNLPDDWIEQIVNRLRNDPEAEWVEIVRCKECKHKYIENKVWACPFGLPGGELFYCAYGAERRTNENNNE